jgi:hypothetical protein
MLSGDIFLLKMHPKKIKSDEYRENSSNLVTLQPASQQQQNFTEKELVSQNKTKCKIQPTHYSN